MLLKQNPDRPIILWLFTGCFFIFLMVVIGGITRLTGSGLSITEWNVIMGAVPPMNDQEWQIAFEKYKLSPQFQKVNWDMTLDGFKSIFFWEYFHRLVGRAIGVIFIVPFSIFLIRKKISRTLLKKLLALLALGGLQGVIGWLMVKSGLVDNPYVSHYRLAIHMITAFITFGYTFWLALDLCYPSAEKNPPPRRLKIFARLLLALIMLQIIYGAFVAGLHAGKIFNTFPKMGDEWFPSAITSMQPGWKNIAENLAGVQFVHRCIALLLTVLIITFWFVSRKTQLSQSLRRGTNFLLAALMVQFLLGVFTLLYAVPVPLGVLHQCGAFFLFASAVFVVHRQKNVTATA